MGYILIPRKSGPLRGLQVRFGKDARITFNKAISEVFRAESIEYVTTHWDEQAKRIAFRPSGKKDGNAYQLHFPKDRPGASFQAKQFFQAIEFSLTESRVYDVLWNQQEKMLEVQIKAQHLKKERKEIDSQISNVRKSAAA
jgi:hypothetical protein